MVYHGIKVKKVIDPIEDDQGVPNFYLFLVFIGLFVIFTLILHFHLNLLK